MQFPFHSLRPRYTFDSVHPLSHALYYGYVYVCTWLCECGMYERDQWEDSLVWLQWSPHFYVYSFICYICKYNYEIGNKSNLIYIIYKPVWSWTRLRHTRSRWLGRRPRWNQRQSDWWWDQLASSDLHNTCQINIFVCFKYFYLFKIPIGHKHSERDIMIFI